MGEKYGPVVYEELQSRLEKTIDIFHKDVDNLFSSFSTYKTNNDKDNNPNHSTLNRTKGSMLQGSNRYDRGINYFDHLIRIGNEFNTPLRWRFSVMRGIDHNTKKMTQPAIKFLLKDLDYKD